MVSKSELWSSHMAAWKSSGLTQVAYCRQHALSLPSFGYLDIPPMRSRCSGACDASAPGHVTPAFRTM